MSETAKPGNPGTSRRRRALVVAPGRGSYGPNELGSFAKLAAQGERAEAVVAEVVFHVDAARARLGLGSIRAVDETKPFSPDVHLEARNASALIFALSCIDSRLLPPDLEVAGVLGNSLGFYTALALTGALPLDQAARLVVEVSQLQREHARGKQLLVPVVGEDWRPSADRRELVRRTANAFEGSVFPSIHLGGFEVLGLEEDALEEVLEELGKVRLGGRDYPLVLEGHHAYHTPLVAEVAERAGAALADLSFREPTVHLVDGRGCLHTPWSTDRRELAAYTLGHQLVAPFDLTAALRVGLRELAPDAVVLLGPGESIGGAIGQVLVEERIAGVTDKDAFQRRQKEDPILYALGRADQRARLLGGGR